MILAADRAIETSTTLPRPTRPGLQRLAAELLDGRPEVVARALLGTFLVHDDGCVRRVGRIVETEAYAGPEDRASHARAGRTRRTSVMFGPPGRAYVYLVYGLHHCLNVVCNAEGEAAAVLIRAVEPVEGIAAMRAARGRPTDRTVRLAAGPARTCEALGVDRRHDGLDLLAGDELWLATDGSGGMSPADIAVGPRIGVDYAGDEWAAQPWRFGVASSHSLSRPFPAHP